MLLIVIHIIIDLHIEYHYTIMLLIYIHCSSSSYTHIDLHIEYHYIIGLAAATHRRFFSTLVVILSFILSVCHHFFNVSVNLKT